MYLFYFVISTLHFCITFISVNVKSNNSSFIIFYLLFLFLDYFIFVISFFFLLLIVVPLFPQLCCYPHGRERSECKSAERVPITRAQRAQWELCSAAKSSRLNYHKQNPALAAQVPWQTLVSPRLSSSLLAIKKTIFLFNVFFICRLINYYSLLAIYLFQSCLIFFSYPFISVFKTDFCIPFLLLF